MVMSIQVVVGDSSKAPPGDSRYRPHTAQDDLEPKLVPPEGPPPP